MVKHLPANAGDLGLIPGLGRSLEKETATHSSTLAWKIPWTEKAGRLQSMGSQKVRCDLVTPLFLSSGIIKSCLVASFFYALWIILSSFCFSIDYFFLWWIWFPELFRPQQGEFHYLRWLGSTPKAGILFSCTFRYKELMFIK